MANFVKLGGKDGKSAYEIWLEQGNSGTEQDFLNSLKGEDGEDGTSTRWYANSQVLPESNTFKSGDMLITYGDDLLGNIYLYSSDAIAGKKWVYVTNIKGSQGEQGFKGENGIGIDNIELSSSSGNVDTYVITYSNGELTTFTVTNGKDGVNGQDGVSPTMSVNKSGKVTTITIADKNGTKTATINDGADGANGKDGANGVSATHSWSGTTLTITSASGTSSANLKGEKGEQGEKGNKGDKGDTGESGKDGTNGKDGTSVTVSSVSESTADGGNNVVTFSNGKTITIKNGSKGSQGDAGKTPVKGTDYFTASDKAEIVNSVKASLTSETWTFTLDTGETVNKVVLLR